ncbi:MAG: hypothetical protein M3R44_01980, partial [Candidatus Eremiobacteraeota bacterium]|nr:hypothetical protein [Candidatus Eremiobacteraeota bacterium]
RAIMPHGVVIGRQVTAGVSASSGSNVRTIVGVVGDARTTYAHAAPPTMYLPILQVPFPGADLIVRGERAANAVAATVPAVDPLMPVPRVRTLSALMGDDAAQARLSAASVGALALVALLLALAGIYAVVSYNVAQRTHEIGVRMALGANIVRVLADVVVRAMKVASIGILAGIVIAVFVARAIAGQLYGISPFDPLTFVAVIVAIALASIAAALIPARRAIRVDPIVALRYE